MPETECPNTDTVHKLGDMFCMDQPLDLPNLKGGIESWFSLTMLQLVIWEIYSNMREEFEAL